MLCPVSLFSFIFRTPLQPALPSPARPGPLPARPRSGASGCFLSRFFRKEGGRGRGGVRSTANALPLLSQKRAFVHVSTPVLSALTARRCPRRHFLSPARISRRPSCSSEDRCGRKKLSTNRSRSFFLSLGSLLLKKKSETFLFLETACVLSLPWRRRPETKAIRALQRPPLAPLRRPSLERGARREQAMN